MKRIHVELLPASLFMRFRAVVAAAVRYDMGKQVRSVEGCRGCLAGLVCNGYKPSVCGRVVVVWCRRVHLHYHYLFGVVMGFIVCCVVGEATCYV